MNRNQNLIAYYNEQLRENRNILKRLEATKKDALVKGDESTLLKVCKALKEYRAISKMWASELVHRA